VPTREQVRELISQGLDYRAAGQRLGIPAGQAYMIATGVPADGGDTISGQQRRRGGVLASSQDLANPPHENPTSREKVREWIAARVAADAQMRTAAERRNAEPPEIRDPEDVQDAITVLTRQHNQVRVLLKQLQALPSHTTGGSPGHLSMRKSIVDMITMRLSRHEVIEEEHFWPAVRGTLPDGDERADHAIQQEREGRDTLTALGKLDPDSDEFDSLVEQLVLQVRKHVSYEEAVFVAMREAMSGEDLGSLGRTLLSAEKKAPTRPHPHAPSGPAPAVQAAAAGAAALGKTRDAAGNRPAGRKGKENTREGT
jgi:hypothetical protein